MIYYTQNPVSGEKHFNAIGKVTKDYAAFFDEMGFKGLTFPDILGNGGLEAVTQDWTSEDTVIYQYPSYTGLTFAKEKIIMEVFEKIGLKVIILVHDALTLSSELPPNNSEIGILNRADVVILHGPKMVNHLVNYGLTTPTVIQGPFGYRLTEQEIAEIDHKMTALPAVWDLLYTGNLGKAWFLLDYPSKSPLVTYGPWPGSWEDGPEILKAPIDYRGKVAPEELPVSDFKGFGLVWDGNNNPSRRRKSRYTAYNMPLKVSNYLSHELPLVAWSSSAIAPIIESEKIGITLDNLGQLDEALAKVTLEDYNQMVDNLKAYGRAIRNGDTLKQAIQEAMNLLSPTDQTGSVLAQVEANYAAFLGEA